MTHQIECVILITMNNHKNLFIKWFIMFAAISAGLGVAGYLGLFSIVLASDVSHLTTIITALFLLCSLLAGKLSFDLSRQIPNRLLDLKSGRVSLKRRLKFLNFMADTFFVLGLMGTIIGFIYMMRGTLNVSADVSTIITQLKTGSSTKLFTTLFGLVSSLLLQAQLQVIESDLIEDEE